jgi:hypothetical protein
MYRMTENKQIWTFKIPLAIFVLKTRTMRLSHGESFRTYILYVNFSLYYEIAYNI